MLKEDEIDDVKIRTTLIKPKKAWKKDASLIPDVVGRMTVMHDGKVIAKIPVYYENERHKNRKSISLRRLRACL